MKEQDSNSNHCRSQACASCARWRMGAFHVSMLFLTCVHLSESSVWGMRQGKGQGALEEESRCAEPRNTSMTPLKSGSSTKYPSRR